MASITSKARAALAEESPAPAFAKEFAEHEEIGREVRRSVENNLDHPSMHNREALDDLIADLTQYRDTLATADEYLAKDLL